MSSKYYTIKKINVLYQIFDYKCNEECFNWCYVCNCGSQLNEIELGKLVFFYIEDGAFIPT